MKVHNVIYLQIIESSHRFVSTRESALRMHAGQCGLRSAVKDVWTANHGIPGNRGVLRSCNKLTFTFLGVWVYSVIPFTMKFIAKDLDLLQLVIRDFDTCGVFIGVDCTFHFQPSTGLR